MKKLRHREPKQFIPGCPATVWQSQGLSQGSGSRVWDVPPREVETKNRLKEDLSQQAKGSGKKKCEKCALRPRPRPRPKPAPWGQAGLVRVQDGHIAAPL